MINPVSALSCPFCGFTGRISVQKVKTTSPAFFYYAAHCVRCGAQGPLGYSDEEGAWCWNARLAPLDSENTENGNPFLEHPGARDSVRFGDPRYWPITDQQQKAEDPEAVAVIAQLTRDLAQARAELEGVKTFVVELEAEAKSLLEERQEYIDQGKINERKQVSLEYSYVNGHARKLREILAF